MAQPPAAWTTWRDERDANLREDFGWLTLVALNWLTSEPQPISAFPGKWRHDNSGVHIHFGVESGVRNGDQPARRNEDFTLQPGETNNDFSYGTKRAEVAWRGDRVMVRVRDNDADLRREFAGIDCFEYDPEWVVTAKLLTFDSPRTVKIGTSQNDYFSTAEAWGMVLFDLPGSEPGTAEQVLRLTGSKDDARLAFYDATNGDETAAWRAVKVEVLDEQRVRIDFNFAHIFPGHMTPYGTCPRPVAGNVIEGAVTAGEKQLTRKSERVD